MKIILENDDVVEAIKDHVTNQGIDTEGKFISVAISTTRVGASKGITATVNITDSNVSEEVHVDAVKPNKKKGGRPRSNTKRTITEPNSLFVEEEPVDTETVSTEETTNLDTEETTTEPPSTVTNIFS